MTNAEEKRPLPALSIVIPAFDEACRIGPTLDALREYARRSGSRPEVIVVDDGSTDGTADVVRRHQSAPLDVRVLSEPANRGKGWAVRRGVSVATGELILICDADLSTPIEEIEKLRRWLSEGYDVAIGSRDLAESRLEPPQPLPRRLLAWGFRMLRRRILLPQIRDTQCGFKLFRGDVARSVFAEVRCDGWLFDCEALAIADRQGCRIREVGVVWRNDPQTRVKPVREALPILRELLALRRRLEAGE